MKKEERGFENLSRLFRIYVGLSPSHYYDESDEWVSDGLECQCGTVLKVSEFQKIRRRDIGGRNPSEGVRN
jgi:hypothetical protein